MPFLWTLASLIGSLRSFGFFRAPSLKLRPRPNSESVLEAGPTLSFVSSVTSGVFSKGKGGGPRSEIDFLFLSQR